MTAESDWFRVLGVKLWHDGSPYTGSMYMAASYLDTPLTRTLGIPAATRGSPMISHEALVEAIRKYTAAGWQVAIHSQGDASNREVMNAVEAAAPLQGVAPVVRLEHGVLLPEELLPKLAGFGVTASFHVNHLLYYGDDLADAILGEAVTAHALPIARSAALGLRPTLHADSPMFPARPFSLMRTAVTRQTSSGRVIGPAQALTVRQALRASTIDAAWQLRMEDKLGSLEPGKLADLQVVPRDPYEVPPRELDALAPEAVYVGGRLEWPRS